jgi:hypothetical protein
VIFRARASAPRGRGRATLRVFGLPLCILSLVGCRTYDDHRYRWYDGDYGYYGHHRHRAAPLAPQVHQLSPPPVFVAPQRPPHLPPQPPVIVRPPERKYEHPRRDDRPSHWSRDRDRDRGQHLNGGPDRKRGR